MSVSLESLLHKSVCCYTAHGDEYRGRLEALDGSFDVVLAQCTRSRAAHGAAAEPLVFVRGEHIVYLALDDAPERDTTVSAA
ncbi:LSM domain containing protein [Novymonas esmeraldas]|uniref:LSM domain containing protein n=1 Tax=Novymonas esmeraldas TaxID=1808958 RepID=A0AAW0EPJ4_9TRYP